MQEKSYSSPYFINLYVKKLLSIYLFFIVLLVSSHANSSNDTPFNSWVNKVSEIKKVTNEKLRINGVKRLGNTAFIESDNITFNNDMIRSRSRLIKRDNELENLVVIIDRLNLKNCNTIDLSGYFSHFLGESSVGMPTKHEYFNICGFFNKDYMAAIKNLSIKKIKMLSHF